MKVVDDFLSYEVFSRLEHEICGDTFPWYFNDHMTRRGDDKYQFVHNIFNVRYGGVMSGMFGLFEPVIRELGVKELDRIKINLNPRTFFHRKGHWHIDNNPNDPHQHTKTAILYLNTTNGWTEFKNHGKVKNKMNRIALFDSQLIHRKVTCTDEQRRIIVNINYQ